MRVAAPAAADIQARVSEGPASNYQVRVDLPEAVVTGGGTAGGGAWGGSWGFSWGGSWGRRIGSGGPSTSVDPFVAIATKRVAAGATANNTKRI